MKLLPLLLCSLVIYAVFAIDNDFLNENVDQKNNKECKQDMQRECQSIIDNMKKKLEEYQNKKDDKNIQYAEKEFIKMVIPHIESTLQKIENYNIQYCQYSEEVFSSLNDLLDHFTLKNDASILNWSKLSLGSEVSANFYKMVFDLKIKTDMLKLEAYIAGQRGIEAGKVVFEKCIEKFIKNAKIEISDLLGYDADGKEMTAKALVGEFKKAIKDLLGYDADGKEMTVKALVGEFEKKIKDLLGYDVDGKVITIKELIDFVDKKEKNIKIMIQNSIQLLGVISVAIISALFISNVYNRFVENHMKNKNKALEENGEDEDQSLGNSWDWYLKSKFIMILDVCIVIVGSYYITTAPKKIENLLK